MSGPACTSAPPISSHGAPMSELRIPTVFEPDLLGALPRYLTTSPHPPWPDEVLAECIEITSLFFRPVPDSSKQCRSGSPPKWTPAGLPAFWKKVDPQVLWNVVADISFSDPGRIILVFTPDMTLVAQTSWISLLRANPQSPAFAQNVVERMACVVVPYPPSAHGQLAAQGTLAKVAKLIDITAPGLPYTFTPHPKLTRRRA